MPGFPWNNSNQAIIRGAAPGGSNARLLVEPDGSGATVAVEVHFPPALARRIAEGAELHSPSVGAELHRRAVEPDPDR